MTKLVLLLLALVPATLATLGFDAIDKYSSGTFNCLSQNGYSFFIARVGRSNGEIDETGIANIKTARAAGWKYVDGYIFPCTGCSTSAAKQVQNVIDRIKAEGAEVGMIWLDVEVYKWPSMHQTNRNFISSMANTLTSNGINWGIYTKRSDWEAIVGLDFEDYKSKPLWWAQYNGKQDLSSNWASFAGWTKPSIHQYSGDAKGPCGVTFDQNYY